MVRVVEALGSRGAHDTAGGHVGVGLGVPTVLDPLPGHAGLKLCHGRTRDDEEGQKKKNDCLTPQRFHSRSTNGRQITPHPPTNKETNVRIAGRRADLAASWTWPVCSPFCSPVCGASCPQCLERVSPSCHYRVFRSGSTGTLLSPSWHWVRGLQGGGGREHETCVKRLHICAASFKCTKK